MEPRYEIEIEPEVRAWLGSLPREHYRFVERHADIRGARMSGGYHTQWKIRMSTASTPRTSKRAPRSPSVRRCTTSASRSVSRRAGLTEAEVEQIEGGGAAPTLPLLRQLASALDAQLDVSIDADAMSLAFVPHAAQRSAQPKDARASQKSSSSASPSTSTRSLSAGSRR
ncbi:hypothetical protein [Streptomyces sp. ISL-100]|uniref:helix-turn-helix domain-containing protein n=1 Tax=Streptomyces sp. ISL-100 TaxID=2819173 RepID=UPI001BE6B915|nr:hypothetical protein [Streptomyces sp. ISL-100]MBT2395302.1 hypothetical protein [Streptomyces sp. ISL-100]